MAARQPQSGLVERHPRSPQAASSDSTDRTATTTPTPCIHTIGSPSPSPRTKLPTPAGTTGLARRCTLMTAEAATVRHQQPVEFRSGRARWRPAIPGGRRRRGRGPCGGNGSRPRPPTVTGHACDGETVGVVGLGGHGDRLVAEHQQPPPDLVPVIVPGGRLAGRCRRRSRPAAAPTGAGPRVGECPSRGAALRVAGDRGGDQHP